MDLNQQRTRQWLRQKDWRRQRQRQESVRLLYIPVKITMHPNLSTFYSLSWRKPVVVAVFFFQIGFNDFYLWIRPGLKSEWKKLPHDPRIIRIRQLIFLLLLWGCVCMRAFPSKLIKFKHLRSLTLKSTRIEPTVYYKVFSETATDAKRIKKYISPGSHSASNLVTLVD